MRDTVVLLNYMPNSELADASPRSVLDGERLNYERWSRVYAGQVAEFEIPYVHQNKKGVRKEIGYVIGHQGDNPIVRLLPQGKRLVIRSAHVRVLEKSPAILQLIEQGITGAKRQQYNDLLTEIDEFYASSPDEPSDIPVPISESFAPDDDERTSPSPRTVVLEQLERAPSPTSAFPANTDLQETTVSAPDAEADPPQSTAVIEDSPPITTPAPDQITHTPQVETQPRRSSRSGANKPEGFYARLNRGENVADYTACHMRASECERLYGVEPTLEAGLAEVTNMIGRGAAIPQDYRSLTEDIIKDALPSFLFYKAKDELPGEEPKTTDVVDPKAGHATFLDPQVLLSLDTTDREANSGAWTTVTRKSAKKRSKRSKRAKLKGRFVGGGHRQSRAEVLAERVAPTARGTIANRRHPSRLLAGRPRASQWEASPHCCRPLYHLSHCEGLPRHGEIGATQRHNDSPCGKGYVRPGRVRVALV